MAPIFAVMVAVTALGATAERNAAVLRDAFKSCLQARGDASVGGWTRRTLPGLGRSSVLATSRLPVSAGSAFAYQQEGGSELVCGVVLYGVSPPGAYRALDEAARGSGWPSAQARFGVSPEPKASDTRVYADPLAPSLSSVTVLARPPPQRDAPALQAEFHAVLVH